MALAVPRPPALPAPPVLPAAPPPTPVRAPRRPRDPFVDVVRAVGTLGVVMLHWLMAEATWDGRALHVGNALGHGAGWLLTWGQPLALLFFAAGASAAYGRLASAAAPGGPAPWTHVVVGRLRATARPVGAFAGAWAVGVGVLLTLGVPDAAVWRLARMAPQLLWFLAVWVVLVALVPVLHAAWRRWRWGALGVAVALPLLVDGLRFGLPGDLTTALASVNILLAWAVPFLAGVAYADLRSAWSRRASAAGPSSGRAAGSVGGYRALLGAGAVVAVVALAVLVVAGPYPPSMIGMPGDAISNLGPPTAPVVALGVAQVCLVLLARESLVRSVATPAGARVLQVLSRRSMTVYLWHLTAMFAVVGVVLLGLGQRLPVAWSADWWASRPVWFAGYLVVLLVLVRLFGRFEDRPRRERTTAQVRGSGTA
ncbi:acyltransferase family protein [Isoptericola sp. NEAU-Y5]|uniref:Acyltransferase family protein n=1 Tax=Isoptericola luteus TaxID=2879484 RepID=A0ABS7ZHZ5_9MICO|nr:acyltransferase family protein [Isoptericola sp. NEAU-Y5]MCA5894648.1 acyltransferase family protein [Isoptericola sp. NEAU-Y5]